MTKQPPVVKAHVSHKFRVCRDFVSICQQVGFNREIFGARSPSKMTNTVPGPGFAAFRGPFAAERTDHDKQLPNA